MGITARGRRLRRLGGLCALGVLVGATAAAPAPAAVAPTDALDRVLAILAPSHANRSTPGAAAASKHELTLALRDLAAGLAGLTPARRSAAERLLARPTGKAVEGWGPAYTVPEARLCDANLCIHWVESTDDAPPGADGDPGTVPEWARTTLAVFQQVWATEVDAMGYRAPKTDSLSPENGGDGRLDVYLADVGDTVYRLLRERRPRCPALLSLGLLRGGRRLRPHSVPWPDERARRARGDRGARVLPRRPVLVRLPRGHVAHGGHGCVDRGRGVRRRERQPPVPEREPALTLDDPARPQLRSVPLRRLDLLALPVRDIRLRPRA